MVAKRHSIVKKRLAEKFVECIMPPDILTQRMQFSPCSKQRRGMQTACLPEGYLRRLNLLWQRTKNFRPDLEVVL
jgi:hypothetical protein